MLTTDDVIINILVNAKKEGNPLLTKFKIGYPDKTVAQESNSIFVACVDYEFDNKGFEFDEGKDLVEILVVIKKRNRKDAIKIIKTTLQEIRRLIYINRTEFSGKITFRNITPEYDSNYVLNRGHMLLQVRTIDETPFENDSLDVNRVCLLLDNEDIHFNGED